VRADLETLTFHRIAPGSGAGANVQLWHVIAVTGEVVAQAEVFPGETQWGVRVQDRIPSVPDADLLRVVAKLLVWYVNCPTDTVDVVLGRTHDHHTLVRVGGDYV
jgi:hypothetical protein